MFTLLNHKTYAVISVILICFLGLVLYFNPYSHITAHDWVEPEIIAASGANFHSDAEIAEIAVITGTLEAEPQNIFFALNLMRQNFSEVTSVRYAGNAQVLVYATDVISDDEVVQIRAFLAGGGSVVFAVLPEYISAELAGLLGIVAYQPGFYVGAMDIYDGVFLSGRLRSENFSVTVPHITLDGRCKVYAHGYYEFPQAPVEGEEHRTPVIWRTFYSGGAIYAVSAPFFDEPCGMGVLAGLVSMAFDSFVYPIIGVRASALLNFPFAGDFEIYYRPTHVFSRDIIWPDLVGFSREFDATFTAYVNPANANWANHTDILRFFNDALYIHGQGELAGTMLIPRVFRSARAGVSANQLTSIAHHGFDNAFTWASDTAVNIPFTGSVGDDFPSASVATAVGFSFQYIDFEPVFRQEKSWRDLAPEAAHMLSNAGRNLAFLTPVAARDAAEAVKDHLNTEFHVQRQANKFEVSSAGNNGEVTFVLRTRGMVVDSTACSVTKINDGVYIMTSNEGKFIVEIGDRT